MPFSPDNPNRNRNFVIAISAGTTMFAIVMAGYIAVDLAGRDTDSYSGFLTLLIVTLVPSLLAAWQAFRAQSSATKAAESADKAVEVVEERMNGQLDARLRQANRDTRKEREDREDGGPAG